MKNNLIFIALVFALNACKVYSFTGSTLQPDVKTISIDNFGMMAPGGPQDISLRFNEKLKEYYQRNSNLKIAPITGDLILSGVISGYTLTPVSVTSGDKAALNRLTITVSIVYQNLKNEKDNFDRDFSFYQDFPQEQSLSEVEKKLVDKIIDQLVVVIFNETVAQW